ncbi:winged helix-turn-helix domain-containing protein [Phytoactinopolyspora mesophila]|uniref:GntR family transcriptional regulator n=1 Tax=Phytoactinopolyspora mesophila TaxID=2650750 RepID=A0A7K3MA67_9ACTN|nr:winged helix-turn-helix domain-containing protein [Phytoactinopolyspora mesophila]NDL60156.1 GntR family transcriptional regulator [Phytoactinopolyspora mesophila]
MSDVPVFGPERHELLYVAIADHLAARIKGGEFDSGSRLASERVLADEYGVAYLTVRRAMVELRERGLILTVHGKGTFVAPGQGLGCGNDG